MQVNETYDPNAPEIVLLEEGFHEVRIDSAREFTSRAGNACWEFVMLPVNPAHTGAKLWHYITLGTTATVRNVQRLIDACGWNPNDDKVKAFDWQPKHFVGKTLMAEVTIIDDNKGREKNDIARLLSRLQAADATPSAPAAVNTAADSAMDSSDVPF